MLRVNRLVATVSVLLTACIPARTAQRAVGPDHVGITWMSITNMYYELGSFGLVTDGYISRVPKDIFFGATTGMAQTRTPQKPDVAAVSRSAQSGRARLRTAP